MVLVHGSLDDYRRWEPQVNTFAKHHRTITYSRRYHYPNPWNGDGSDYSVLLHTEDLAALITSLELGPAHIVGHSYGGYISLLLALRHPELVRTLVLGEPPVMSLLQASAEGRDLWAKFLTNALEPSQQAFQQGQLEEGVRRFLDGVVGSGTFDQIPPSYLVQIMENARELQAELLAPHAALYPALSCAEVGQVKAPTLLLTGELSPHIFHKIIDLLERCLPQAERMTLAGVSHEMEATPPDYTFNSAVLTFLERHSRES